MLNRITRGIQLEAPSNTPKTNCLLSGSRETSQSVETTIQVKT